MQENPCQRQNAKKQAEGVMPFRQTGIRKLQRTPIPELHDAQHDSDERQNTSNTGSPHHHVPPEIIVGTERGEVEPVRNR
jgi:hypothetical protein